MIVKWNYEAIPPPPSGLSDDQETAAEFIQEGAGTQGGDTERD